MAGLESILHHFRTLRLEKKMAGAFLLVGADSADRVEAALAVVKESLCQSPKNGNACEHCGHCLRVNKRQHESLFILAPEEGARRQIKADQAREVREFLYLRSLSNKRFVVIEHCEDMLVAAANSLLKILEEPDEATVFLLLAESSRKVMPTLRSRSQIVVMPALALSERQKRNQDPESWRAAIDTFVAWASDRNAYQKAEIREQWRERGRALQLARNWVPLFRDWMTFKSQPDKLVHMDLARVFDQLPARALADIGRCGMMAVQLESALLSNRDSQLVFEEFWLRSHGMELR